MRLDGSASSGYATASQPDGTWSTLWQTGDGFDAENIIKTPHVYTVPGVYTARLTVKDASGASSTSTVRVTVNEIPAPSPDNIQTLSDSGNAETNRIICRQRSMRRRQSLQPARSECQRDLFSTIR
jgi:PKD repeat protein